MTTVFFKQNPLFKQNPPLKSAPISKNHPNHLKIMGIFFSSMLLLSGLSGCNQSNEPIENRDSSTLSSNTDDSAENQVSLSQNQQPASDQAANEQLVNKEVADIEDANNSQYSTRDKSITLDWSKVDSGEVAVDPAQFNYPFDLESKPVLSQAQFSDISTEQAQLSLTIGMASNEPLEKIIDQLRDSYISHKFSETEGKLLVYTTPNVTPSSYDYVISNDFAKGLILPIELRHASEQQLSEKNSENSFH